MQEKYNYLIVYIKFAKYSTTFLLFLFYWGSIQTYLLIGIKLFILHIFARHTFTFLKFILFFFILDYFFNHGFCRTLKHFLDTDIFKSASFNIDHVCLFRFLFSQVSADFPIFFHIYFVRHQNFYKVLLGVLINFSHPIGHIFEWFFICDIVDHKHSHGLFVVVFGDVCHSVLARCIKNLEFYFFSMEIHFLNFACDTYRR